MDSCVLVHLSESEGGRGFCVQVIGEADLEVDYDMLRT